MPHYKNGELAQIGDIVRGKGYNIKDEKGELKEITGIIADIELGMDSCNVKVVGIRFVFEEKGEPDYELYSARWPEFYVGNNSIRRTQIGKPHQLPVNCDKVVIIPFIEYGQADHFEKVG